MGAKSSSGRKPAKAPDVVMSPAQMKVLTDRARQLAAVPQKDRLANTQEALALLSQLRSLTRRYRSIGLHHSFQRASRKLINAYNPPKKRDRATEKLKRELKQRLA